MQEAAVLLFRSGKAGCKLQCILDLLAGDRHQTGHIAKRADLLAGLEGPVAGFLIGADAATVHDSNVTMQLFHLIEVGVNAVGHEVAEIRLCHADAALPVSGSEM